MSLSLQSSRFSDVSFPAARALGGFHIGPTVPQPPLAWPMQHLRAQVLGDQVLSGDVQVGECWIADAAAPLLDGENEGIAWRRSADLLFGAIELHEDDTPPGLGRTPLQQAAFDIYGRIFRLLDAQGLPQLWRLWNFMADINGHSHGLERYRQFNMGRGDAFEAGSRRVVGRVPAACALGLAGGPLTVAFMAGASPAEPVENPRQLSAFLYPDRYGPRSPTFARAALVHPPGQEILFLSGTASIVGHQTVHPGDVRAQTSESLDNIAAVLDAASARSNSGRIALPDLGYRAYVRHVADLEAVREVVHSRVGDAPVLYLRADVCRSDLLVEIEGQCVR